MYIFGATLDVCICRSGWLALMIWITPFSFVSPTCVQSESPKKAHDDIDLDN